MAVLPINPAVAELSLASEYFTEQLLLALDRDEALKQTFRIRGKEGPAEDPQGAGAAAKRTGGRPAGGQSGAMPQSTTVAVYADAFHAIIVPGSS